MKKLQIICVLAMFSISTGHCNPSDSKKIHASFHDDPSVIGQWESVDFVSSESEFSPDKKRWQGKLALKHITFKENGKNQKPWLSWTKGLVIHQGDSSIARYQIKEIGGEKFMFLEWMSGDVIIRNMKPKLYVFKKVDRTI